jgi:hypothetical protein
MRSPPKKWFGQNGGEQHGLGKFSQRESWGVRVLETWKYTVLFIYWWFKIEYQSIKRTAIIKIWLGSIGYNAKFLKKTVNYEGNFGGYIEFLILMDWTGYGR